MPNFKKSKIGTFIYLMTIPFFIQAQHPVNISIYNESTTIPFTTVFNTPIHPGIQLGTEFNWKESRNFRMYPGINVGYMLHRKLFHGIYVNAELGLDLKTSFRINLKGKLGVGYLHTFTTQQEYQFRDGKYISKPDKGNARIMPSLTFGLGYNLRKNEAQSPEIFVLYQSWLEYPYSPGFIPLMSHTNLHVGTKFYPVKNRKSK